MVGGSDGIFRQDNVTGLWQPIALNTIVQDILVVTDSIIYLACDESGGGWGGIVASLDGGDTYTEIHNDGLLIDGAYRFSVNNEGKILMNSIWHLYISHDVIITNSHKLEDLEDYDLSIYPNPCQEIAYIKSKIGSPLLCQLFNAELILLDTFILSQKEEKRIDLSKYPSGIYFLKNSINSTINSIKIIHY